MLAPSTWELWLAEAFSILSLLWFAEGLVGGPWDLLNIEILQVYSSSVHNMITLCISMEAAK